MIYSQYMLAKMLSERTPEQIDKLWSTYHHIAKLSELGGDEQGNRWRQAVYGSPIVMMDALSEEGVIDLKDSSAFRPAYDLCGTGMCFAGWYAALQGLEMNQWGLCRTDSSDKDGTYVRDFVMTDARLDDVQAAMLFHGANSLPMIREVLTAITGEDRG